MKMQSNENLETKDLLRMGDARFNIGGSQPEEKEDNTAKGKGAPDGVAKKAIEAKKASDCDGDMMPPPTALMDPPRPPSSAASDKDDYETLSLQEFSGRSSTPYTLQSVCCDNANCELGNSNSTTVSPVKEEAPEGLEIDLHKLNLVSEEGQRAENDNEGRKYTISDLINIRDCMTIVKPDCLGSLRIKRLNFLKSENSVGSVSGNKYKTYRAPSQQNDLMPAFCKRKTAPGSGAPNSITYDTFKYTDSHGFGSRSESGSLSTQRRIGSGRIQSTRDVNWDYIPEEDPDRDNLPEFFTTKETTSSNAKLQQQRKGNKSNELDDNSNYIKRMINSVLQDSSSSASSSFRGGSSKTPNNSGGEERHAPPTNRGDEPEWFSCGPTSRLDTIELCGFNETDQQDIRMDMTKGKNKPDLNNNGEDEKAGGAHKEKKHLAFQFDEFSSHNGKGTAGSSNPAGGSRMPGSKFLPLFNTKKREEEQKRPKEPTATQIFREFFNRPDLTPDEKEKLLASIPSVNEIEAKCRMQQQQQQQQTGMKTKEILTNLANTAEQFQKVLNQLHQHTTVPVAPQPPAPSPQQQNQPVLNLFNNDNLSNFIKQRNIQQQVLQKQQQAAFAQLQLNAILSRPEAQMLLLSLARGEISKQGLIVQLANPNLPPADREAITAVLSFSAAQQQLAVNTNQHQQFITNQLQHLAMLQQQINKNAAAKRSGGANGFQPTGSGSPRTFSQEELQSHANLILQNAMMKKRLEEQSNLGLQKFLQLQNSVWSNVSGANARTNDTLAGSKNQPHHQQQQQQQQQLLQNRNRKTPTNPVSRVSNIGRRRSTSSTSSSNAGSSSASHMKLAADLEYRQLEQRRNTIATTNPTDEFLPIPQNI